MSDEQTMQKTNFLSGKNTMFEELGEAALAILQFLDTQDLVSIILVSRAWLLSKYATRRVSNTNTKIVDNILWKNYFDSLSNSKYKCILCNKETQIKQILSPNDTDTYKRAISYTYKSYQELKAEIQIEMRKFITSNTWTRAKHEYYGIPQKVNSEYSAQSNLEVLEQIKILSVGDGSVGKSSMLITYTCNFFPAEYCPSVFDNFVSQIQIDGQRVGFDLWDTGGWHEYDKLRPLSYPCTDVLLLVFSVVDPISFRNVVHKWLPEIRRYSPNVPILLCGSKIDLRENTETLIKLHENNMNVVSYEEGEFMAKTCGCIGYVENSALTQEGITKTFNSAIRCAGAYRESKQKKQDKNKCVVQ